MKEWVHCTGIKVFTPRSRYIVCSEHFEEEDFHRIGQKVRLKSGSVPTLFNVAKHFQQVITWNNLTVFTHIMALVFVIVSHCNKKNYLNTVR